MDSIGWCIANLHQLLGHDKTAIVLGVPAGNKAACLICQYEAEPTDIRRVAVERAMNRETLCSARATASATGPTTLALSKEGCSTGSSRSSTAGTAAAAGACKGTSSPAHAKSPRHTAGGLKASCSTS